MDGTLQIDSRMLADINNSEKENNYQDFIQSSCWNI